MGYIKGEPREQSTLFPERIEDYVGKDNPVRFIDKYVDSLDLARLGFKHSVAKEMGRPAYHRGDLLRLYIYGYLNRIRSARDLEKETIRNLEVMWLIRKLRPDFRTIANFRRDNGEALRNVFREFSVLCRRLDLFGKELVGIDGSKFQAVNSKDNNYSERKLNVMIQHYEERISQYMKELESAESDEQKETVLTEQELEQKIEELRERKEEKQKLLEQLKESGQNEISVTDPDSRRLHAGDGSIVGYNVQMAVDSKHFLVVDFEVTNDKTDQHQLANMSMKAKEVLQIESLKVVADSGYYCSEEIKSCQEAGVEVYVEPVDKPPRPGLFSKDKFIYQADTDSYLCPANEHLRFRGEKIQEGRQIRWYETSACKACSIKHLCTGQAKRNRRITRWIHQDILEKLAKRMAANPQMRTLRKSMVEHPFGTIKRTLNHSYFLLKGFKKVTAEMSLIYLAYNIKRVLKILGTEYLLELLVNSRLRLAFMLLSIIRIFFPQFQLPKEKCTQVLLF
ncbi:MAG TPA: IS1182 family transposase [Acidobacteriota bacterium]|jgi:transposase